MFAYTVWKIPVITYYYISKEISCTIEEFVFRTVKTQVIIKVRNLIDDKKGVWRTNQQTIIFCNAKLQITFYKNKEIPFILCRDLLKGIIR